MNKFDRLKALLREGAPSAARLADSVDAARKTEAEAIAEVGRIGALKVTLLDAEDGAQARNRAALTEAKDRVETAGLYVQELTKRYRAAAAAESEQARLDVYNVAKAKADAAAKSLRQAYPRLVADALALLKLLAEAQITVDRANEDLPAGATPILDPEAAVRGSPDLLDQIVKDEEVVLWARMDQDRPAEAHVQAQIYDVGKGWGKHKHDVEPCYLSCRFRRVETLPYVQGASPLPLASYLRLPSLTGKGLAWGHHHE